MLYSDASCSSFLPSIKVPQHSGLLLASTTSLGNFYRGQEKDFLALLQSYEIISVWYESISVWYESISVWNWKIPYWYSKYHSFVTNLICAHINLIWKVPYWNVRICQFDMFENINMVWQNKGSKVILKNSRLMTSFGLFFLCWFGCSNDSTRRYWPLWRPYVCVHFATVYDLLSFLKSLYEIFYNCTDKIKYQNWLSIVFFLRIHFGPLCCHIILIFLNISKWN